MPINLNNHKLTQIGCLKLTFCKKCGSNLPSEDALFCSRCGAAVEGNINSKDSDKYLQNNVEQSIIKATKNRSRGTGKIIGGILLLLFGISAAGFGLWAYNHATINTQNCNTLLGQLSQLDPHDREICNATPTFLILGAVSGIVGAILLIIGIILIGFGIKQKSK